MSDFLKNFWQDNLAEIRENKIRFGAILTCLIVAVIFALADSTAADTEIPVETPPPVEVPADKPIQPAAVPTASENLKVVFGANSSELYVSDPFTAPVVEIPEPAPPPVPEPELPAELPPVPVEIPAAPKESTETFALKGTAITGDFKTAIIHKISGGDKAQNLVVSVGDTLGNRRVVDITASFVALDDGSQINLAP